MRGRGDVGDGRGCVPSDLSKSLGGDARGGGGADALGDGAVEADQGVEVDGAAGLHFGNLGELHRARVVDLGRGHTEHIGEVAPESDGEASPQFGGPPLPHEVVAVAVAVGADRLPEQRVVLVVSQVAPLGLAVRAELAFAARVTGLPAAGAVHRAEGRGGESEEDQRIVCHGLGDVLAALDAAADHLEGVAGVQAGAGRADGFATVAAALEQDAEGLVGGAEDAQHLARVRVDASGGTGQTDGMGAVADVRGSRCELVEGAVLDAGEKVGLSAGAQVEVERGGLSESLEAGPRVAGHAACGPS